MDTELVTARLRLRRTRAEDVDALHALASDWEVVKQTASWPWPPDRAFTTIRAEPMAPEKGMAGPVFLGDTLVGMMGVHITETGGELGYMFGQAHWGQGFATEMGRALIDHAFARYDWPSIAACVFAENPASARVLLKLGFEETGCEGTGTCEGQCAARGETLPTRSFRHIRP